MLRMRLATWALVASVVLTGCGSGGASSGTGKEAEHQAEVAQLQERIKSLEAEVSALKEAPQELLKQAVEAREKAAFDQSAKLLDEVEKKYPASPEAAKVPGERDRLKQAVMAKQQADRKDYDVAVAKAQGEMTPETAKAALQAYLAQSPTSVFKAEVDKKIAAYDEQIRIAAEEAKKPPLEIVAAEMSENSIGVPEINLTLRNISRKVIDGMEFSVDLFDNYDRAVNHYRSSSDGNTYSGISQDKLAPGARVYWTWTMHGFDLATKYKNLRLRSVHFTDGTTWRP